MKQNAKICAIGEQIEVFILEELIRRERRDSGEGEERGLRKGEREDRDREKRDKRELSNLKRRIRNIDTCLCLFPQGTAFLLSS